MQPPEADTPIAAAPQESPASVRTRRAAHDAGRLRRLALSAERRLGRHVVGQGAALASLGRALRRAASGLSGGRRPLATLLFVGPTGSGKTELARALALELGGPERLVRVDCSEFGGRHEVSKLLGAPPGYVGHEHGGVLRRRLARAHETVVLFDEVEKAHPQLHELLLQVLDDGRLTDGRGEVLDFRRSFVVLTSNTGTREWLAERERLGFPRGSPASGAGRETVTRALGRAFAPEFLARLDEVVAFDELCERDRRSVAERALLELAVRVRARHGRVCFSAAVAGWAARAGFTSALGARGILNCVRREIEAPLAEALLGARSGEWIEVSIRRGRPHLAHAA